MDHALFEIENMASNAAYAASPDKMLEQDLERWQRLFGMSAKEARNAIERHRSNLSRQKISDDLWNVLARELLAQAYDREAYEYSLTLPQRSSTALPRHAVIPQGTFIVKLEGPIDSPEKIQEIGCLSSLPHAFEGVDADRESEATFCEIDGNARHRISSYLSKHHPTFRPTFVRLAKAKKDLSPTSIAPFLGIDSTLPHHRPHEYSPDQFQPAQEEYPVWYFFYGTLCDRAILSRHLNVQPDTDRRTIPASVRGACVKIWGGRYQALVDDFDAPTLVRGCGFLVEDKMEEDGLRGYEGEGYEVVRCGITLRDFDVGGRREVRGLTFRFAGDERELEDTVERELELVGEWVKGQAVGGGRGAV